MPTGPAPARSSKRGSGPHCRRSRTSSRPKCCRWRSPRSARRPCRTAGDTTRTSPAPTPRPASPPTRSTSSAARRAARLREEMQKEMAAGFKGTFPEFLKFLRTDPRFYATSREDLMEKSAHRQARRRSIAELVATLPRLPYGVREVPLKIQENYTTAIQPRFAPARNRGRSHGQHVPSRPAAALRASGTDAARGGARTSSPDRHRAGAWRTAMVPAPGGSHRIHQGWAWTPSSSATTSAPIAIRTSGSGKLSWEMWRACRLLPTQASTGRAGRLTRPAPASPRTPPSRRRTSKTSCSATSPGQALAYKIGELKLRELRKRGEASLGARFICGSSTTWRSGRTDAARSAGPARRRLDCRGKEQTVGWPATSRSRGGVRTPSSSLPPTTSAPRARAGRGSSARAWLAPDRDKTTVVEWVVGHIVVADVGPDLRGPLAERVELHQRPLGRTECHIELDGGVPALCLAAARSPRRLAGERAHERLDLADAAAFLVAVPVEREQALLADERLRGFGWGKNTSIGIS